MAKLEWTLTGDFDGSTLKTWTAGRYEIHRSRVEGVWTKPDLFDDGSYVNRFGMVSQAKAAAQLMEDERTKPAPIVVRRDDTRDDAQLICAATALVRKNVDGLIAIGDAQQDARVKALNAIEEAIFQLHEFIRARNEMA